MVVWTIGLIHILAQLAFVVSLPLCNSNVLLDSFYCDIPWLIKFAGADTYKLVLMVTANSGLISLAAFFLLSHSYTFILATLQEHSSGSSSKAPFTLSAHIIVVILFFDPLNFFHMWPSPSTHLDKFIARFDAVLTPFLNPVMYTPIEEQRDEDGKEESQLTGFRKNN